MILVSYMMPMAVTGLLGKNIFMNTGLINDLLSKIGILGPEWLVDGNKVLIAVIIINCWVGIPFAIITLRPYFKSIPVSLDEAARLDGCSTLKAFTSIMIPAIKSGIVTIFLTSFRYIWLL